MTTNDELIAMAERLEGPVEMHADGWNQMYDNCTDAAAMLRQIAAERETPETSK